MDIFAFSHTFALLSAPPAVGSFWFHRKTTTVSAVVSGSISAVSRGVATVGEDVRMVEGIGLPQFLVKH